MEKAEYKKLENGTWFAEIPGFKGVWANGDTVEKCRTELLEVLEGAYQRAFQFLCGHD